MRTKKKLKYTLKQMKWEYKNLKSMWHSESSPKRKFHSFAGLPEETWKMENKQSNFTIKESWKRTTNTALSEQKEGNKDRGRNEHNRV